MVISISRAKSDDAKRIKHYWSSNVDECGGILHDILQDRNVDDVDILWALRLAIEQRDANAIMICGYMLSIKGERDRKDHLTDILGWPTS